MNVTPQHLSEGERAGIEWRVSRFAGDDPDQVEVGTFDDGSGRVALRHRRHPDGDVIVYTAAEWQAFTAGVRDGEFDFG